MTSDRGAGDRAGPDHARLKVLRAADAFDRRDHAMTVAAYELHILATSFSAARDHPGFVPDEYLASLTGEDLHSPGADPAFLATELRTARMWRRIDGGYRVLDWPAVQACIDHMRELRAVDKRAPVRKRASTLAATAMPLAANGFGTTNALGKLRRARWWSGVAGGHLSGADGQLANDPADDDRDHRPGGHGRYLERAASRSGPGASGQRVRFQLIQGGADDEPFDGEKVGQRATGPGPG